MTAAAIPGRRERAAARPVPWTRLTWVTWRQSRAALAGAAALLVVIAAYLAYMGWEINRAYDSLNACLPASMRGLPWSVPHADLCVECFGSPSPTPWPRPCCFPLVAAALQPIYAKTT